MAAATLSLLSSPSLAVAAASNPVNLGPGSNGGHSVVGGSSESGATSAAASASSPPDLVEDFFELSARVLSRLSAFAFHAEQRDLQATVASCACRCLLMAHREALSATCHYLSTLLSEGSDATLAKTKRGRPLVQQHCDVVRQLLTDRQLAAQLAHSIAYGIAVHLPQQAVHLLTDPVLLLYYCIPQHFPALLSHALQPYTLPPQPQREQPPATALLDAAAIERFNSQLLQLAEAAAYTPSSRAKAVGRSVRDLLEAFAYSCRQKAQR